MNIMQKNHEKTMKITQKISKKPKIELSGIVEKA
jgi:hypothetical protein